MQWNTYQIELLKELYPNKQISLAQIAVRLGNVTTAAVRQKANELKLKRRIFWTQAEVERLQELAGEYPKKILILRYNNWAKLNGYVQRHPSVIYDKLKNARISTRLEASTEYFTSADIASFLGCHQSTVSHWFKYHANELKPSAVDRSNSKLAVSRKRFRSFITNHLEIVERYRQSIDLLWLVEILIGKAAV